MARVICDMSTSVDGYITGPNASRENPFGDGGEGLHDWIFDAATDEDRALLQEVPRQRRRRRDGSHVVRQERG